VQEGAGLAHDTGLLAQHLLDVLEIPTLAEALDEAGYGTLPRHVPDLRAYAAQHVLRHRQPLHVDQRQGVVDEPTRVVAKAGSLGFGDGEPRLAEARGGLTVADQRPVQIRAKQSDVTHE
jgi:hypothetical protein